MVVTSRVTHATPASFSAHQLDRDMETEIAQDQLGFYSLRNSIDLMFGGGRCFFIKNNTITLWDRNILYINVRRKLLIFSLYCQCYINKFH